MAGIFRVPGRTSGKITRRNWCFDQQPYRQKKYGGVLLSPVRQRETAHAGGEQHNTDHKGHHYKTGIINGRIPDPQPLRQGVAAVEHVWPNKAHHGPKNTVAKKEEANNGSHKIHLLWSTGAIRIMFRNRSLFAEVAFCCQVFLC